MSSAIVQRKSGGLEREPGAAATTEAPRSAAAGLSRDMLKGASYDEGAQMLAPGGAVQLKYERGLGGGSTGSAPVQMEKTDSGAPVIEAQPDGSLPTEQVAEAPPAPVVDPAAATAPGTATTPAAADAPANDGKTQSYGVEGSGHTGYIKDDKGQYVPDPTAHERSYVSGGGYGKGDRESDLDQWVDEKDHSKGKKTANKEVDLDTITDIPAPELDKIAKTHEGRVGAGEEENGAYAGYDVRSGSASGGSTELGASYKYDPQKGEGGVEVEGPNAYYQKGASAKAYAGAQGKAEGDAGKVEGKAEAYGEAYAGLSGKAEINQDGASATGAIGAGVEIGVTGDADYHTPGVKIDGVEKELDAGVGVHGEAKAYAKAGAGGGAYLTKDKVGLEGSIGAAAVAEAKADIHGNLGPVAGKYEVGVLAGAGIGASGGIVYENGKLRIGGRVYAALGYGVSTGGEIEIDLKQSYELGVAVLKKARDLGVEGAQAAFKVADADQDGKLSLNDAATHGANAMEGGAETVASGMHGVKDALDADGDGKFTTKDVGKRVDQAGEAISDAGKAAYKAGGEAVDAVVGAGKSVVKDVHDAADMDGDGELSAKDVAAGAQKVEAWAGQKVDAAGKAITEGAEAAAQWGSDRVDDGIAAIEATHKFLDRSGDGELGMDDVKKGAGEVYDAGAAAVDKGTKAVGAAVDAGTKYAGEKIDQGVAYAKEKGAAVVDGAVGMAKDAHKAADRDGDGSLGVGDVVAGIDQAQVAVGKKIDETKAQIGAAYDATKAKIESGAKAVYDAADLNKDGTVDSADAAIAAARAKKAASDAAARAKKAAADAYAAGQKALADAQKKAAEVAAAAHKAADRDGDGQLGVGDVVAGGKQAAGYVADQASAAKTAIVKGATAAYDSASSAVSQAGQTLSAGYDRASSTVGAAYDDLMSLF